MGFYLELQRHPEPAGLTYREDPPPAVFWVLYLFLGFALTCMGLAARTLLGDLARTGSTFDQGLVGLFVAFIPLYGLIGLKLGFVRRYVAIGGDTLRVGYRLGGRRLWERRLARRDIAAVEVVNQRPAPNNAPLHHDDPQYFVRGHWRVVARRRDGKSVTLDRNTDREPLLPLAEDAQAWLG